MAKLAAKDRELARVRTMLEEALRQVERLDREVPVCARCKARMCSECGASMAGRSDLAMTCSGRCRVRRLRRLRAVAHGAKRFRRAPWAQVEGVRPP